jgi:nitrite reductase/ring-hydroxylating ferredoxin subunit
MLAKLEPEEILNVPEFEKQAYSISRGVHNWVLAGGKSRRRVADFLHGTWMGHPLHSVMTDMTIGAWTFSFVLDLLSLSRRTRSLQRSADTLLDLGNATAATTALAGLTDYSTVPERAVATGATHALINTLVLTVALTSAFLRRRKKRRPAIFLSAISSSLLLVSAWLGGELVYRYKVGVNKSVKPTDQGEWHPTIAEQELPERTPKRVDVAGAPVLLYRYQGQVYAMGAVCGHDGGPLEQGTFEGYCVTCPLHQSVYDLRDGSVVHGPTTYTEPHYEVRVRNGQIEVQFVEKALSTSKGEFSQVRNGYS